MKGTIMKLQSAFIGATLLVASSLPAQAVVCTSTGFSGGIPSVVGSLTITDGTLNSVTITDFTTKLIQSSDPDNSSAIIVYDEFEFGSSGQAKLSAAGLTMGSGTKISGSSGDFVAEVTCD